MKNIKWASKINPNKLVLLYKNYMANNIDEADIDDVGIGLYLRCHDIILISEHICRCPECGTEFSLQGDITRCPNYDCDFSITKEQYERSWRHKDLCWGKALSMFAAFHRKYPLARGIDEKMILIDTLIHSFHWDLKANLPNRAAGNNLIEGSLGQVVDILDQLSGVQPENDAKFKETVEVMWIRRKGVKNE